MNLLIELDYISKRFNLKFYQDGSFICHVDTILDNMKLMEEAINSSGFKEDVKIGLVIQADNFYIPEQKKYELENPKKPEDTDQMVFYKKYLLFNLYLMINIFIFKQYRLNICLNYAMIAH